MFVEAFYLALSVTVIMTVALVGLKLYANHLQKRGL